MAELPPDTNERMVDFGRMIAAGGDIDLVVEPVGYTGCYNIRIGDIVYEANRTQHEAQLVLDGIVTGLTLAASWDDKAANRASQLPRWRPYVISVTEILDVKGSG
jgi:hypothetical protein